MSQAGHLSWMVTGSQMPASFPSGDKDPARLAQLPSYSLLGCLGEEVGGRGYWEASAICQAFREPECLSSPAFHRGGESREPRKRAVSRVFPRGVLGTKQL